MENYLCWMPAIKDVSVVHSWVSDRQAQNCHTSVFEELLVLIIHVIRIHHNDIKDERDLRGACITIAFPFGISEAELHGHIRNGGGGLNSIQYTSPSLLLGREIGIEIYL